MSAAEAVRPVRVVRSEAELGSLAADSIVCGVHDPGYVFQRDGDGNWFEPGTGDGMRTPALWEFLTGAYETVIVDEDREVWVLYDAAQIHTLGRPARANPSHAYVSGVRDREPCWVTHETLDEARARIEDRLREGPADVHLNLGYRPEDRIDFHSIDVIHPGTALEQLPWMS